MVLVGASTFYGQRKVLRARFDAHRRSHSAKEAMLKKMFDKLPQGRAIVFAHGDAVFKSRGKPPSRGKTALGQLVEHLFQHSLLSNLAAAVGVEPRSEHLSLAVERQQL
jgi:hypothetical protein